MARSQQLTRRNFFNMNWMGLSKCIWKTSKIMALHNSRLLAKHCQDFSTRPFTEEPNRAWFQHKNIMIFSTLSHFKFFMLKSLSLIWERSYFPSNRLYKKRKKETHPSYCFTKENSKYDHGIFIYMFLAMFNNYQNRTKVHQKTCASLQATCIYKTK
jgi:hypothetical protein